MKEQYKNSIEQQHAPRELIEKTKQAMNQALEKQGCPEEESTNKNNGHKKKIVTFRYLSVAAAFLIVVGSAYALNKSNQVLFHELTAIEESENKDEIRFGTLNPLKRETKGDEFDQLWKIEISNIESVLEYEKSESSFYVIQSLDGQLEEGQGSILYKRQEKTLKLNVAFGVSLLPGELQKESNDTIKGQKVWFAKNEKGDYLAAYFEIKNGSYSLTAENTNQKEFVKAIKKLMDKLQ